MWGKAIGMVFGYMLGIKGGLLFGLIGAFIGYAVGDMFDQGMKHSTPKPNTLNDLAVRARENFFEVTFSVMGYIAKSDGRVSEKEIHIAQNIMHRLGLDQARRMQAIAFFNLGKQPDFRWTDACDKLMKTCRNTPQLLQLFLEIQIETTYADGTPSEFKRMLLIKIADWLGFPHSQFLQLEQMILASQRFHQNKRQQSRTVKQPIIDDAYEILGVKKTDDNQTITTAYRRLISQHHPDKLVSKGLPEDMIRLATEKTHQIKSAYERIRQARNF